MHQSVLIVTRKALKRPCIRAAQPLPSVGEDGPPRIATEVQKDRMGGEAAAATPNPNPNPKLSSLNPNWAQLQQKLKTGRPHKPSPAIDGDGNALTSSVLGKRKERPVSEPEASPQSSLTPTSSDIRCPLLLLIGMIVTRLP